ncbi:SGNH/GDSL hydrolase family protein [Pseudolysinimonas sp.]|uniref:SGNH/GDSL hydrolase family protein n=1 Tax=Pseudolysinimonas sp. TaxID=2680009 RepID=UPI00286A15FB|nr:SGNH/GDSL hydrolase family protein [Pseudolysinimonas sp.]
MIALLAAVATGCAPQPEGEVNVIDPDIPLVAFYGDSYTLGTGATDPANRWSTLICEDRGWTEFNPSLNGLGFINNRGSRDLPGEIVAQAPDIVFVTMGLNDNFSYDRVGTGIRDQIVADFAYLSSELPEARVIVVEPFWYTDERPKSVEIIIGWVRDAAADIGADWIPGASHWIEGHPDWMADDRLHPNDDGYAELARRMDAELAQLGL